MEIFHVTFEVNKMKYFIKACENFSRQHGYIGIKAQNQINNVIRMVIETEKVEFFTKELENVSK